MLGVVMKPPSPQQYLLRALRLQRPSPSAASGRISSRATTRIGHPHVLQNTFRSFHRSSRAARHRPQLLRHTEVRANHPTTPCRSKTTRRTFASAPPPPPAPPAPQSLRARLRALSREYGYAALGVYLGLTALDFPFCFLAVRALGTERIGKWEHVALDSVWGAVGMVVPGVREWRKKGKEEAAAREAAEGNVSGAMGMVEERVEEAKADGEHEEASLGTQLAIAYAIHKSFIFVRVPLTAAVTPKVVKVLRSWGWNIGKRKKQGPK